MLTDDRPVRRWVWVIPVIIAVTALAGMNYAGLGEHSAGFMVLLAVSMLGVGFAEEGMFRGLGVVTFRVNGFTEAKVALWTCVLFGLAHATNLGLAFFDRPRADEEPGRFFPSGCESLSSQGRVVPGIKLVGPARKVRRRLLPVPPPLCGSGLRHVGEEFTDLVGVGLHVEPGLEEMKEAGPVRRVRCI